MFQGFFQEFVLSIQKSISISESIDYGYNDERLSTIPEEFLVST
jgi:hypothetical protein